MTGDEEALTSIPTEDEQPEAAGPPPIPQEFFIDQPLIDAWFRIDGADTIQAPMPRASFDMLYIGIERSLFAALRALDAANATNEEDRQAATRLCLTTIIEGLTGLRQFQSLLMANATGQRLDGNFKVIDGGEGYADS